MSRRKRRGRKGGRRSSNSDLDDQLDDYQAWFQEDLAERHDTGFGSSSPFSPSSPFDHQRRISSERRERRRSGRLSSTPPTYSGSFMPGSGNSDSSSMSMGGLRLNSRTYKRDFRCYSVAMLGDKSPAQIAFLNASDKVIMCPSVLHDLHPYLEKSQGAPLMFELTHIYHHEKNDAKEEKEIIDLTTEVESSGKAEQDGVANFAKSQTKPRSISAPLQTEFDNMDPDLAEAIRRSMEDQYQNNMELEDGVSLEEEEEDDDEEDYSNRSSNPKRNDTKFKTKRDLRNERLGIIGNSTHLERRRSKGKKKKKKKKSKNRRKNKSMDIASVLEHRVTSANQKRAAKELRKQTSTVLKSSCGVLEFSGSEMIGTGLGGSGGVSGGNLGYELMGSSRNSAWDLTGGGTGGFGSGAPNDLPTAYLPRWMMASLKVSEGGTVNFKLRKFAPVSFIKLQPIDYQFLERIENPKVALEHALQNYTTLTAGNEVRLVCGVSRDKEVSEHDSDVTYSFKVTDCKPNRAVCVLTGECKIEFEKALNNAPPDFKVVKAIVEKTDDTTNAFATKFEEGKDKDSIGKENDQQIQTSDEFFRLWSHPKTTSSLVESQKFAYFRILFPNSFLSNFPDTNLFQTSIRVTILVVHDSNVAKERGLSLQLEKNQIDLDMYAIRQRKVEFQGFTLDSMDMSFPNWPHMNNFSEGGNCNEFGMHVLRNEEEQESQVEQDEEESHSASDHQSNESKFSDNSPSFLLLKSFTIGLTPDVQSLLLAVYGYRLFSATTGQNFRIHASIFSTRHGDNESSNNQAKTVLGSSMANPKNNQSEQSTIGVRKDLSANGTKQQCPICERWVPSRSFERHKAFCERNNDVCYQCFPPKVYSKRSKKMLWHKHCEICNKVLLNDAQIEMWQERFANGSTMLFSRDCLNQAGQGRRLGSTGEKRLSSEGGQTLGGRSLGGRSLGGRSLGGRSLGGQTLGGRRLGNQTDSNSTVNENNALITTLMNKALEKHRGTACGNSGGPLIEETKRNLGLVTSKVHNTSIETNTVGGHLLPKSSPLISPSRKELLNKLSGFRLSNEFTDEGTTIGSDTSSASRKMNSHHAQLNTASQQHNSKGEGTNTVVSNDQEQRGAGKTRPTHVLLSPSSKKISNDYQRLMKDRRFFASKELSSNAGHHSLGFDSNETTSFTSNTSTTGSSILSSTDGGAAARNSKLAFASASSEGSNAFASQHQGSSTAGNVTCGCRYCKLKVPLTRLESHEMVCGSRSTTCHICGKSMAMKKLGIHLATEHSINPCLNQDTSSTPKKKKKDTSSKEKKEGKSYDAHNLNNDDTKSSTNLPLLGETSNDIESAMLARALALSMQDDVTSDGEKNSKDHGKANTFDGEQTSSTGTSYGTSTNETTNSGWSCPACTFFNNALLDFCEICGGRKK
eukprot:g3483.t1